MKVSKKTILLIILFVCLFLFITIPIPYYILQTGETDPVHSYISVDNGYKNDGELTFVTVTLKRATPIQYLWAKISTDREVQPIDEIHANDLTEKEHLHAIQEILKSSLEMAKASAYKEASKRYEIKFNGLKVISTSD